MSDESGTYIILLKLKKYFVYSDTHTLKCRNEDVMYGHNEQLPGGPTSK